MGWDGQGPGFAQCVASEGERGPLSIAGYLLSAIEAIDTLNPLYREQVRKVVFPIIAAVSLMNQGGDHGKG